MPVQLPSVHAKLLLLVLLMGHTLPSSAQKAASTATSPRNRDRKHLVARRVDAARRWLEDARTLTGEIKEESRWLGHPQDPILLARLGEAWFHVDPVLGRSWLDRAVRELEIEPPDETASNHRERLAAAHVVLKVVMPLDRQLADRVLKLLPTTPGKPVETGDGQAGDADRLKQMQDLNEAVQSVVRDDPKRAAELGKLFLGMHNGDQIKTLLGSLRTRAATQLNSLFASLSFADPQTANQLFSQAVASARTDHDYAVLFTLSEIAFPTVPNSSRPPLPAELQTALLQVVSEGMIQVPQDEQDRAKACQIAPIAARLLSSFSPAQMASVQSAIQLCQGTLPSGEDEELQDAMLQLRTSTDYLNAAVNELNLKRRCRYKSRAALHALQEEGDSLRALSIWDGFTTEERDAYATWAPDREAAAQAAVADLYHMHDLLALGAVIDRTPDALRPKLLLHTVALVSPKDRPLAISLLTEARRCLENNDVDDPAVYLMLLNAYLAESPAEVASVLELTVAGINRIRPRPVNAQLWVLPAGYDLCPYQFDRSILDLDRTLVESSVGRLASPLQRVRFRMALLQASLKRYQAELEAGKPPMKLARTLPRE